MTAQRLRHAIFPTFLVLMLLACAPAPHANAQPSPAPPSAPSSAPQPTPQEQAPPAPTRLLLTSDLWLAPPARSGHAWALLPQNPTTADLIHLPPRGDGPRQSAGSVRLILPLSGTYQHAASWDGRLYLLAAGATDESAKRTLWTLAASSYVAPGSYRYTPPGRLEALAPLTGPGRVVGLVGTHAGPVALLTAPAPARYRLTLLDRDRWLDVPLPPIDPSGSALTLLPDLGGLAMAELTPDGELKLHIAAIVRTPPAMPPPPPSTAGREPGSVPRVVRREAQRTSDSEPDPPAIGALWAREPSQRVKVPSAVMAGLLGRANASEPAGQVADLLRVDGRLYATLIEQNGTLPSEGEAPNLDVQVYRLGEGEVPLVTLRVAGVYAGVVGEDGLSRLAVVNASASRGATRVRGTPLARGPVPDIARLSVTEVSLITGQVIGGGLPANSGAVVSRRDMQLLWLVLLAIGAVTLIFVVRSDGPTSVRLPEGASLGTPGRRMVAGAIDLMVALIVVGLVMGQTPLQLLSAQSVASAGLGPLLGVLLTGCFHTTVCEAIFGRSVGKFAVGLRVSAMRRSVGGAGGAGGADGQAGQGEWVPGEPRVGQVLVRNLVRWCLPPIGMLMFLDGSFRHAGDLLARTLVVLPEDTTDTPDEE